MISSTKTSRLLFLFIFCSVHIFSSNIIWHSVDDLLNGKNINNKTVYVLMYADWDFFGKKFLSETIDNKAITKELNTNFFAVKFNINDKKAYSFQGKLYEPKNTNNPREIHPLGKLWMKKTQAVPYSLILNTKLNIVASKNGMIKSPTFLEFLDAGKARIKRIKEFKPMVFVFNAFLQKILDDYETDFKNLRGQKNKSTSFDMWDSKLKIPGEISSHVGYFLGKNGKKEAYYKLTIAEKVSIEQGKKIIVNWTNIIMNSNLKQLLEAIFLGYKAFDKGNMSSMQFIISQANNKFNNVEIAIELIPASFFYKDNADVYFVIRKK